MYTSEALIRSSRAIGSEVRNPRGEDLGRVEDLVIAPDTGRVVYAVLSFGGVPGVGERWLAVPWEAFTIRQEESSIARERYTFVLDVERERLAAAPGFHSQGWPDRADLARIYDYYGYRPYWEA
ncbi:MAG: PRC-barrel domain-containing protein [Anaerolineae bacterium]